jgi:hypothetical protein
MAEPTRPRPMTLTLLITNRSSSLRIPGRSAVYPQALPPASYGIAAESRFVHYGLGYRFSQRSLARA